MPWLRGRATDYPEPPVEAQAVSAPQPPQPEVGAPPFTPADPAPIPPDDGPPLEAYADDASQHDDGDEPDDDAVPMSEDMLAGRFMDEHAANWRYVKLWNAWYEWRGDGWYVDDTGRISELARLLVRSSQFWAEARSFTPLQLRAMNQKRTCWNVRDLAQTDARVTAKVDQWDRDSWLLGIPGGVIDLKTGETLKASRDQYITKRAAVAPEEGEPAIWTAFLRRITGDDESLMEYLQRFAGYSLTGETSEHALAFLYGTGANGKTTFLHTLSKILGDYAISAGFEVLAESKGDRHPTEIARLRGARLVVTEETDAGGRWNEGRVKRLTGGGKISAHFMRQDDFEFEPQFKLLIAGNHKPVIRAVDEAIKRRIHLIPFTVTIPAEERDKTLMDRLKPEWPRILNWAIRGCILWQERSLSPGERIIEATNEYVEQEDILGAWLDENCERDGEADGRLLYENYRSWCDKQGEHAWSRRGWGSAMLERGFQNRKSNGQRWFVGVHARLGSSLP
jgi:putative DNA primase/helicase